MRRDDAPAFGKSHPHLTLPAQNTAAVDLPGELECDAAEVTPKCNYVQSLYGARKVHSGPCFAKSRDFLKTVQVFRSPKAKCMLGIPKHRSQGLSVVGDEGGFIPRVKRSQLSNDFGIVDYHR